KGSAAGQELGGERVGAPFEADRRDLTVARKNLYVVRHRQDLLRHRFHELLERAAGEIRTTDGAGEEVVAGEQDGRFAVDVEPEAHRAAGVAGGVDRSEGHAGTVDALAVVEAVDELRRAEVEALEVAAQHAARADGVEQHVEVFVVDSHQDLRTVLEPVHDGADAADVIDVAV